MCCWSNIPGIDRTDNDCLTCCKLGNSNRYLLLELRYCVFLMLLRNSHCVSVNMLDVTDPYLSLRIFKL